MKSFFNNTVGMKKNLIENGHAGRQDDLKIPTASLVPKYFLCRTIRVSRDEIQNVLKAMQTVKKMVFICRFYHKPIKVLKHRL